MTSNTVYLTGAGRPVESPQKFTSGGKTSKQVVLDRETLEIAARLGCGNVSRGIRTALRRAKEDAP